ncbi:hypothetical protein Cgig2_002226 [Carnegiea gigantea]|uniref:THUMP domain-containing protein n=1 Tax=Carnegiea gigantea TaxID=171969 RepID=A0A9Q1QPJ9_9CARY|nr:hypothetical protein Cgig2_002226 [Carnegiea gigantea]
MGAETEAKGCATNDGRKRKRRYLPHNKPVKKKGPSPLRPGVQGFFITCDGGRERQASHEALNVIDSFFEDLVHGKNSSTGVAAVPEKPLNKKIKFTYSDSSDSEGDDDNDDESEEEDNESERLAEGDKDKEGKESVDDKTSDDGKRDGHPQDDLSEKTDNKEVDKQQVDGESKENEEPPAKKQCGDAKNLETVNHGLDKTEKSVDKLIEAELQELTDKGKRRFSKLDTGCNGVVFIQMRKRDGDPGPREIVQHMMEVAATTKKHMSRFLLRVLPVEVSCYTSPEEISRAVKPLFERYFDVDAEAPVKFAVQYDARANSGIERMKIIDAVAKSVPAPHKVDLKNPEKTIIVQIIKTVCLIGVVQKYKELAKYNVRQLTSS